MAGALKLFPILLTKAAAYQSRRPAEATPRSALFGFRVQF